MIKRLIFATEESRALTYAATELEKLGVEFTSDPSKSVTHLLLPVPCKLSQEKLTDILAQLPQNITLIGGHLDRPELSGYTKIDLLKDEQYQAENAMITAYCAITLAAPSLPLIWQNCPVLILGWGRIGKCLGKRLHSLDADVSIAARKETDLAMATALGYDTQNIYDLSYILRRYRVIFNTVPYPVLTREQTVHCRPDCLKIELASKPGILCDDVIDVRGLPGKLAPESSGKLIARTVMRLFTRKEEAL